LRPQEEAAQYKMPPLGEMKRKGEQGERRLRHQRSPKLLQLRKWQQHGELALYNRARNAVSTGFFPERIGKSYAYVPLCLHALHNRAGAPRDESTGSQI
jgi:hypothetical protein